MVLTKQQRYDERMRRSGMKRIQLWVKKEDEGKIRKYAAKCADQAERDDDSEQDGGSVPGVTSNSESSNETKGRAWSTNKKLFP